MAPKVSFIVPCYNLAHLLPDCVNSILAQTYEDFEILIMDDCSPDNTPEVARSFNDVRVVHVRNEVNLRHLQNYNKGIDRCRGKYVWLISADDLLRQRYILEKYVTLMESHPEVGYVFCPGFGLRDREETCLLEYSCHGKEDTIFDGRKFLAKLLEGNSVIAASGMVRKQLYESYGAFPLDLPYAGDWYLWCLFALYADVGYFAEPMVGYREHQLNITNSIMEDRNRTWKGEGIAVAWRIKRAVEATEHSCLATDCDASLARQYGSSLAKFGLTHAEFERSLAEFGVSPEEASRIRPLSYLRGGDAAYANGDRQCAATLYGMALKHSPAHSETILKYALLHMGKIGDTIRKNLAVARRSAHPQ